jgi:hypothetical protein
MKFRTHKRRAEFTHENYQPLHEPKTRTRGELRALVERCGGSVEMAVFVDDGLTAEEYALVHEKGFL